MRATSLNRTHQAVLLALIACGFNTSVATAVEQVSIPYLCRTTGKSIILTPSDDRRYDVMGRREQDIVTACPREDQNRCKSWRIHKFDINCGGARVPWIDVVAAANAQSGGPARVRDGKVLVRMDPWWARRTSDRYGQRPRLSEYGPDDQRPNDYRYRPSGREREIEMPAGYAPMVGILGRFVDGAPGSDNGLNPDQGVGPEHRPSGQMAEADTAPPLRPVPAPVPATKPVPTTSAAKPATPPSTGEKSTLRDRGHTFAAKPAEEKPSAKAEPVTQPDAKSEAKPNPTPAAPPTATEETAALPTPLPGSESAAGPATPKIVNAPGAVEPPKAPDGPPVVTSATSSAGDTAGPNGTQVAAAPDMVIPIVVDPAPVATASRPLPWPILITFGALALLAASAVQWMRRQNQATIPKTTARDIADVWFEDSTSRELVVTAGPDKAPPTVEQVAPVTSPTAAGPAADAIWVPSNRDEALQVLGAGPDASIPVLKKIVDGLRMSWHPDLAKSQDEYSARHERMRQINVAWDILSDEDARKS